MGSAITETVRSATNSPASRSIAIATTRLARRSASSRASSYDSNVLGGVGARLPDHLVHQRALGFLARQAGDGLELGARLVDMRLQYFFLVGETFLTRAQTLIAPIEIGFAPLECFLALFESLLACFEFLFDRGNLAPAIAHLAFGVGLGADHHVLCLEFCLLDYELAPGLSLLGYFFGLSARGLQVNGVVTLFR